MSKPLAGPIHWEEEMEDAKTSRNKFRYGQKTAELWQKATFCDKEQPLETNTDIPGKFRKMNHVSPFFSAHFILEKVGQISNRGSFALQHAVILQDNSDIQFTVLLSPFPEKGNIK